MQIVIEIDKEHHERIMRFEDGVTVYPTTLALYEAVKNGTPLTEWLESFDTSSATECFTAVNLLKQRLEGENDAG